MNGDDPKVGVRLRDIFASACITAIIVGLIYGSDGREWVERTFQTPRVTDPAGFALFALFGITFSVTLLSFMIFQGRRPW